MTHPIIKKLAFAIIAAAASLSLLLSTLSISASSVDSLEDRIQDLERRNGEIDSQIAGITESIAESEELQRLYLEKFQVAEEALSAYSDLIYDQNLKIAEKQQAIEELDRQIDQKEQEISGKRREIEELEEQNRENLQRFGELIHALYVTGGMDIVSVLSESADFYDILVRTKLMMNISAQNQEFMDGLIQSISDAKDMMAQLEAEEEQLDTYRLQLVEEREKLEEEKEELSDKRAAAQKLSDEYNGYYLHYTEVIGDYEEQQQELRQEKLTNQEEQAAIEAEIQQIIQQAQQGSSQEYQEGEWMWPVGKQFGYITTYFGDDYYKGEYRWHNGIDIGDAGIFWTDVYASKSGTVIKAFNNDVDGYSYGKYIIIDHGDGYTTLYGHCAALYVYEGQAVQQGDVIGAVGTTGNSSGPHMHFEVRVNGSPQNPFAYVTNPRG